MTLKTYRSTSVLSFSVTMPAGNYRRIRFTPFSWGGGVYTTEDEKEQAVLESLPEFNNRYWLAGVETDEVQADEKSVSAEEVAVSETNQVEPQEEAVDVQEEAESEEPAVKTVEVADFAEAKEYLMDNFGYKSSQLRSQKSITEAAEKNGITFIYA